MTKANIENYLKEKGIIINILHVELLKDSIIKPSYWIVYSFDLDHFPEIPNSERDYLEFPEFDVVVQDYEELYQFLKEDYNIK